MSGYIGVDGVARKIKKVYVGVDGVAREVKKMYVGVNGIAREGYANQLLPKGTLVKMNLTGVDRVYRILKCDGNVCLMLAMWDELTSQANSSQVTASLDSLTILKYAGSSLDTCLNTTWYNTLTTEAKAAIVSNNIEQDVWYWSSGSTVSGNPTYSGSRGETTSNTNNYKIGKYANTLNIGNRYVYALSIQDVIDYLSDESVRVDTSAALRNVNIWKMYYNKNITSYPNSNFIWLRSTSNSGDNSLYSHYMRVGDFESSYYTGYLYARPAFKIDLSKISYTVLPADTDPTPTSSYTVTEKVSGASYGFALNSSGYYESNNKGVNNSAAVCRVNLNLAAKSNITFTCINYAESNYDFGLLGNVDSALGTTNTVDSSVAKSFKGSSQSGTQTYTYSNVAAGTHFIDVKFRKDSSQHSNNDSLQFKVTIANA